MIVDNTKTLKDAIRIDEKELRGHVDQVVRSSVEETLNALLQAETGELCRAYLAGVSVRRVKDITEALWGRRVSSGTVNRLNQKIYQHIEAGRNRDIVGNSRMCIVYPDGVILKRNWAREVRKVPDGRVTEVARMLKAIHVQKDQQAVVTKLRQMKMKAAADLVESRIEETFSYYAFPSTHWRQIRTNNPLERIIREIRRRARVVGAFADGHSALMLAAAQL